MVHAERCQVGPSSLGAGVAAQNLRPIQTGAGSTPSNLLFLPRAAGVTSDVNRGNSLRAFKFLVVLKNPLAEVNIRFQEPGQMKNKIRIS